MALLKKFDLTGKEIDQIALEDGMLESSANEQMVKDYLIALRANARQWSANTKTRAEVCHSGKKPHPQKGTGRARQGYLGAPQYKGGGRVHAPRPKVDQHIRINKKERRAAIRHLIIEKILENKLHVLAFEPFEIPKTKKVATLIAACKWDNGRILFLGDGLWEQDGLQKYESFIKSVRNLPKVDFGQLPNVNGYDIILNQNLIVMDSALEHLKRLLEG